MFPGSTVLAFCIHYHYCVTNHPQTEKLKRLFIISQYLCAKKSGKVQVAFGTTVSDEIILKHC